MSTEQPPDRQGDPQPASRELPPRLPSLGELAQSLGFESDHDDLKMLEDQILNDSPYDKARFKLLIDAYDAVAMRIMEETGKRSTMDSLALILQLAHFRYIRGMYVELLETSFVNLNEILQGLDEEIDDLVGATMVAVRKEVSKCLASYDDIELD